MQLNSPQAIENGRILRNKYGNWMEVLKAKRMHDAGEMRDVRQGSNSVVKIKSGS